MERDGGLLTERPCGSSESGAIRAWIVSPTVHRPQREVVEVCDDLSGGTYSVFARWSGAERLGCRRNGEGLAAVTVPYRCCQVPRSLEADRQRVEREVGEHAGRALPADDQPGENVQHECLVHPADIGPDVGHISHAQLVRRDRQPASVRGCRSPRQAIEIGADRGRRRLAISEPPPRQESRPDHL